MPEAFPPLNLPPLPGELLGRDRHGPVVQDIFRHKTVRLTPEEWVRQHTAHYLVAAGYPQGLIALEKSILVHGMKRRFDIVVFDRHNHPFLLVECKRPRQKIDEQVLNQAIRYNITLQAPYLMLTNGLKHYLCHIKPGEPPVFLKQLPPFGK